MKPVFRYVGKTEGQKITLTNYGRPYKGFENFGNSLKRQNGEENIFI